MEIRNIRVFKIFDIIERFIFNMLSREWISDKEIKFE